MTSIFNEHELQYRIENQLSSLKMGDMIKWYNSENNSQILIKYVQQFQQVHSNIADEKIIWKALSADKSMRKFFSAMDMSGKELIRRGLNGDSYAAQVFCALAQYVKDFNPQT